MKILKVTGICLLAIFIFASCQKELSVEDGGITAVGSWQFTESGTLYTGNMDSALITSAGPTKTLKLSGATANQAQKFSITLLSTTNFAPGSYKASLSQAAFKYFTQAKTIFEGDFLTGEFIVNITSLTNNSIQGTFSGQAKDSTGNPTQITLGQFTSAIDLSGNGGTGAEAAGTLNSTATNCAPFSVTGTYTQGIPLATANNLEVEVNVTTIGAYTISTNTVNGVSFVKSGTFTAIGIQKVLLPGTGNPLDSGTHNFAVSFKTSTCNIPVTFLPGTPPPPPTGDYFPTTLNSFWVYDYNSVTSEDTIIVKADANSRVINGKSYTTFLLDFIPSAGFFDTLNYRKLNGEYFEALDLYKYLEIDESVIIEYTFLKDNVAAGTTYQSTEFSATINTVPVTGYIQTTILEKASSATAGSQSFNDVIKVKNEYFISVLPGFPVSQGSEEKWYAKGVGLIYLTSNEQSFTLKRSLVN